MKKFLILTLVLAMALSMVACGGSQAPAGNPGTNTPAPTTPNTPNTPNTPDTPLPRLIPTLTRVWS